MNLEEISKNLLSSAGAQNVTAAVLDLITKLRSERRKRPSIEDELIPNQNSAVEREVEDDPVALAHNLSAILFSYFQNDTDLLEMLTNNLRDEEVRWMKEANRRLSDVTFTIIIAIYIIVIAFGSLGNFVVVSSFIRQPALRTQRNSFILNLAISDLVLCLVTMPLTLLDIVNKHWPLGDSALSCKVAGGLQAVSVFVSTISITVIALDRYQLIVYPTRDLLKRIGGAAALFFIWMLGFLLALPIFLVRTLERHELNPPKGAEKNHQQSYTGGVYSIDYCYEKWPVIHGRVAYSVLTLVIQYALPILIISILHTKICRRLRKRHTAVESMMAVRNTANRILAAKRLRRRHNLLIAIALIFCITWLPLNVLNLILDLYNPFTHPKDEEKMLIIYAVCHLFGMSSACANPFLYGWFNDNFCEEFIKILSAPFRLCYTAVSRPIEGGNTRSPPEIGDPVTGQPRIELLRSSSPIDMMAEGNDSSALWIEPSSSSPIKMGNDVIINKATVADSFPVTKSSGGDDEVVAMKLLGNRNGGSFDKECVIKLPEDVTSLFPSYINQTPILLSSSCCSMFEYKLSCHLKSGVMFFSLLFMSFFIVNSSS